MLTPHPKYKRIVIDAFHDGSVPEEVYREVVGVNGESLLRARAYEQTIIKLVSELDKTEVGAPFLEHINVVGSPRFGILIVPNKKATKLTDETQRARVLRPQHAYGQRSELPGNPASVGTGTGSSTLITFNPDAPSDCGFVGGPDAVFFHELTHGLRALSGTMFHRKMSEYGLFEEFVAITLTNMLLSEQKKPLRQGHNCSPLHKSLDEFCASYSSSLQRMKDEKANRALYSKLGALSEQKVPWNPLRGW